jgi:hypothetical protein
MAELKCSWPGCENGIMNHKWGKIHASPEWLFLKSGRVYCPDHWPAWAIKWREDKRARAQARLLAEGRNRVDPDAGR